MVSMRKQEPRYGVRDFFSRGADRCEVWMYTVNQLWPIISDERAT